MTNNTPNPVERPCRCYWCNRARGMSQEEAKAEQHRALVEKRI